MRCCSSAQRRLVFRICLSWGCLTNAGNLMAGSILAILTQQLLCLRLTIDVCLEQASFIRMVRFQKDVMWDMRASPHVCAAVSHVLRTCLPTLFQIRRALRRCSTQLYVSAGTRCLLHKYLSSAFAPIVSGSGLLLLSLQKW